MKIKCKTGKISLRDKSLTKNRSSQPNLVSFFDKKTNFSTQGKNGRSNLSSINHLIWCHTEIMSQAGAHGN